MTINHIPHWLRSRPWLVVLGFTAVAATVALLLPVVSALVIVVGGVFTAGMSKNATDRLNRVDDRLKQIESPIEVTPTDNGVEPSSVSTEKTFWQLASEASEAKDEGPVLVV